MDPLVWFVVVAAVLVVLHVGIAAYLYRSVTAETSVGSADEYLPVQSTESGEHDPGPDLDGDLVACGSCGTPNDPSYRFCRQCVADLTSGGGGMAGPGSTERLGS